MSRQMHIIPNLKTICQRTTEEKSEKRADGHRVDRRTDRRTEGQTDRQTECQTARKPLVPRFHRKGTYNSKHQFFVCGYSSLALFLL